MLYELTDETRGNILNLVARAPKSVNESSFDFANAIKNIETALRSPAPGQMPQAPQAIPAKPEPHGPEGLVE